MSDLPLEQPSPLNLELHGSAGRFRVGSGENQSLLVHYFLTNVGLALSHGTNSQLLGDLAPVREVFRVEDLDFNELMQRDIDDARVTTELVPYLLDRQNSGLVKLFPPIIVMILPVESGSIKPAQFYPNVTEYDEPVPSLPHRRCITRIGEPGSEILQLEQYMVSGQRLDHDRVRLRLNTHGTRLVIVDGQHRAMALLAIYRNMQDQWNDARQAPYKDFYAEWAPEVIGQFDLSEVQLPVMLCFVPELTSDTSHDFNLIKAARQVFLTLNKTARKVSDSRNRLLDDADLIAVFLRTTLGEVKSRIVTDVRSMRIWDVELDQAADRTRVQSPVALTGVNHIYYVIEHLMLTNEDHHGVRARSGRYGSRTSLTDCLHRLGGRDLLGDEAATEIRRYNFSSGDAEQLGQKYQQVYGDRIIQMFDEFGPYAVHNKVVASIEQDLKSKVDGKVHSLLFGGQGTLRVFRDHLQTLQRREDKTSVTDLIDRLQNINQQVDQVIHSIQTGRANAFISNALGAIPDGTDSLKAQISTLYQNYFTTVAMQTAIMATFFGEWERASRNPGVSIPLGEEFKDYLRAISRFFFPASKSGIEGLLRVFAGEISSSPEDPWRIVPSDRTFRRVVYRGEMQPDEWPKLRYIMLELWQPENEVLCSQIEAEVTACRKQIVKSLFERLRLEKASEKNLAPEQLTEVDINDLATRSAELAGSLIENIDGPWPFVMADGQRWVLTPPDSVGSDEVLDEEDDS